VKNVSSNPLDAEEEMSSEIETLKTKLETYTGVLRQALDLIPDEKLDWKPFDYFRTLGQQFYHIMQTESFYLKGIAENEWSFREAFTFPGRPLTRSMINDFIGSVRQQTIASLNRMTEEDLNRTVEIPFNPTRYSVRHWLYYMLEHLVHHKAQISIFLRQLEITPPFFAYEFPNNFRPDIENVKIP
jgi:uncharacterized damage-inducible protein DinB